MGNSLKKKNKKTHTHTYSVKLGRETRHDMVLEHWVNYYFPEVNDENDWLKLVSE